MPENIINMLSNIFSGIRFRDIIDILIVAFAIYKVSGFIRETRAAQLVKGLLFLAVAALLSGLFNLYTVNYILVNGMKLGFIAVVIIFQPELRRGLEYLGRSKFFSKQFVSEEKVEIKELIASISRAVDDFSVSKTGALIILEREVSLNNIAETGIMLDAKATYELLGSIFYKGTPLHDGAVIIRTTKVYAAGCLLPLSHSGSIGSELGTRHRAGIGITEISDSVAIIVSEETGIISVAIDGKLSRFLDAKTLEKVLLTEYLFDDDLNTPNIPFINIIRRNKRDQ